MFPVRAALVAAGLAALSARGSAGDEDLIPSSVPPAKRDALKAFLETSSKPKAFLPPSATIKHAPAAAAVAMKLPKDGDEVTQYLAAVVAHRTADAAGPSKVDVYWYRPNLKDKKPGVTVKQTVDLATGKADGDPVVLVGHPTPLTREERELARKLADKNDAVKAFVGGAPAADFLVTVQPQTIAVNDHPAGGVGDRVATLKFRKKGTRDTFVIDVNVTKETVRIPT